MAKQKKAEGNMVKKETMLVVALVALVVGFLGGIFYSAMQKSSGGIPATSQTAGPPQPQQSQSGLSGEQARTILALEQEVAANPTNVDAWNQLGHIYFDTGNPPKAIRAYEKSLELNPDDSNVITDLGVMYRRNGQPQKALEAFDRASALTPTHEQSRFNKGVVLLNDMNDREGAMKAWEDLLRINPNAVTPNGQPLAEVLKGF